MKKLSPSALWLLLSLALIIATVAYYLLVLRQAALPTPAPEAAPGALPAPPVVQPVVHGEEDLKVFEAGRAVPPPETTRTIPPLTVADHLLGRGDAAVTLFAYTGLNNEYVALMQEGVHALLADRPTDVNWVLRHYPLDDDAEAWALAQTAECAAVLTGQEDPFWETVDEAFAGRLPDDAARSAWLQAQGVDAGDAESCLRTSVEDGSIQAQTSVDAEDKVIGDKRAIILTGTDITVLPTFFFLRNATGELRTVEGAVTSDYLATVLDAMLK